MRPDLKSFRGARPIGAALLLAAALVTGCAKHDLVMRVDLLSFTPELQSPFVFPPVPVTPGGLATGEQALVDDDVVSLIEGLSDASTIENVSFRLRSVATAITGTGTDTLRVYVSDMLTDPRTTVPIATDIVTFQAGVPDTSQLVIDGNTRLNDLFKNSQIRISVTTSLRGPAAGAPLEGSLEIIGMDAVIVAGRKL
ncbi:MAG: hypothetical protein RL721_1876 [Candidatus Eisenbacteria bacterium]|jgi:hypothetical protein